MKTNKIIYWVSTGIMILVFAFSASMYLLNYERVSGFFINLGFPVWLIYPLAFAKILGIAAVLSKKSSILKEWTYAGFFFDTVLALVAHLMAQDGEQGAAIVAIVAIVVSRIYDSKVFISNAQ